MDQQIWQWTLTKESIAPCFVRDVLAMRQANDRDTDYFWLGYTPCRTVLLVGMVVSIQVYDKRTIYTIDDGTAVIDCVLRHPIPTLSAPALAPRSPLRPTGGTNTKAHPQHSSPKKPRLDKSKPELMEPPPPITEPGYPVRVVGKVMQHYQSKQIRADTIDPCPSSLDEIVHLERVIELHKTEYSRAVPFVPPSKPAARVHPPNTTISHTDVGTDVSVFSDTSIPSHPGSSNAPYSLPTPPHMPMPLQNRSRPPAISTHNYATHHGDTHVPPSPTTSSIVSSTPSSPCKPSSPVKEHEVPHKSKLRHPSRLHTYDLTANTFRLYVKHYMDNAPAPFSVSWSSPSHHTCGGTTTPMKHARDITEYEEPTPRPRPTKGNGGKEYEDKDGPILGFTLSHLRRVPELALLAARIVRAETRKRDKANREKERTNSRTSSLTSTSLAGLNERSNGNSSTPMSRTGSRTSADPPRKKMARLFSWAVVRLYEEGSIVLWDGDVRPLPVPPPPPLSGLWHNNDAQNTILDVPSASCCTPSISAELRTASSSASVLYTLSASAPLFSQYQAPRRPTAHKHHHDEGSKHDVDVVDPDADPGYLSDPPIDEEAYVSLTPQFLARYVRDAAIALRRGGGRGGACKNGRPRGGGGTGKEPTPEDILTYMQRKDSRWARVGVWAVEEALALLKRGKRKD